MTIEEVKAELLKKFEKADAFYNRDDCEARDYFGGKADAFSEAVDLINQIPGLED